MKSSSFNQKVKMALLFRDLYIELYNNLTSSMASIINDISSFNTLQEMLDNINMEISSNESLGGYGIDIRSKADSPIRFKTIHDNSFKDISEIEQAFSYYKKLKVED